MMPSIYEAATKAIAAETFFQAKVKEHEAACMYGDTARMVQVEADCQTALNTWLDRKRDLTQAHKDQLRKETRK